MGVGQKEEHGSSREKHRESMLGREWSTRHTGNWKLDNLTGTKEERERKDGSGVA